MILRDYQVGIVDAVRASLAKGRTAPLVVAPTGSGKTAIFSHIAASARSKEKRVIVLTHRREIMQQTIKAMHRLGVTCGQIATGRPMTADLIQVAMVGTLVRRLSVVRRPDLIITDECHHTTEKNTWGRIHEYWSSVPNIGFTATPERLDGVGLGDCYDDMILGPTIRELVTDGWLSMPVLYRPPEEVSAEYHIKRGDFDQGEQAEVMSRRKIVGDVIEHYRQHLDGLPVIASCVSVAHAKMMAGVFEDAGYKARAVWGDMPDSEREDALGGLGTGAVQVVTFADLIGEGVDIPAVAGVIMLRRTLSLSLFLQVVGRALRPLYADGYDLETVEGRRAAQLAGPKPRAIILDHAGNYQIHGHVLADRQWSLEAKKRTIKGQKAPMTTTCPACYGIWPGSPAKCPACGHIFATAAMRSEKEISVIAGQLVEAGLEDGEVDAAAQFVHAALKVDAKTRQKMLLGRAFSLAVFGEEGKRMLEAMALAVGYKGQWARWAWEYANKERRA